MAQAGANIEFAIASDLVIREIWRKRGLGFLRQSLAGTKLAGVYPLQELRDLAAGGETETLELKASTAELDRAARTVAGMANQSGGLVLIGVRPDGTVVGQETTERTLEKIASSNSA